jgi:hypothetical protein
LRAEEEKRRKTKAEYPISNKECPRMKETAKKTKIESEYPLGHWIFLVGYWIFNSDCL